MVALDGPTFARCFKVLFTKGIEHFVNEKEIINRRFALVKSAIIPAPLGGFSKGRSDNPRQISIEDKVDGFAGVSSLLNLDCPPVNLDFGSLDTAAESQNQQNKQGYASNPFHDKNPIIKYRIPKA